jgi:hypothetical protein
MIRDILPVVLPAMLALFTAWRITRGNSVSTKKNLFREGKGNPLYRTIEIESFTSLDDYTAINGQLVQKFFWGRKTKILVAFTICGPFAFPLLGVTLSNFRRGDFKPTFLSLIPFIFLVGYWLYLIRSMNKRSSAKLYSMMEILKTKVRYIFDKDYYEVISPTSTSKSGWENVQSYVISGNMIMVFTTATSALLLQKSAFHPADLNAFTDFLASNFEEKKKWV